MDVLVFRVARRLDHCPVISPITRPKSRDPNRHHHQTKSAEEPGCCDAVCNVTHPCQGTFAVISLEGGVLTPLICFHAQCYDGFSAAWAAWQAVGEDAEYRPVSYGDRVPPDAAGRLVYLLDVCFPHAELARAVQEIQPAQIRIIDHHQTARDDILPWLAASTGASLPITAVFDLDHSGAVLAWQHFHGTAEIPTLLRYVEDRDCWRFALPHSRAVAAWMRSWPMDFATWNRLEQALLDLDTVLLEAQAILRFQQRQVEIMADAVQWQVIAGQEVPVVNASVFVGDVGEELLTRYPTAPFGSVANFHLQAL
jgi:uncharacterized protein